jgi:hypothetical protein
LRAEIACDKLSIDPLEKEDWESLEIVWDRMDDATTAMPLYTNAVEGSRSGKRKKKTDLQKDLTKALKEYTVACKELRIAIDKKDKKLAKLALDKAAINMDTYRTMAKIDKDDGGVLNPSDFSSKSGSKVTGTGYVVPVFRGGATGTGIQEDFYVLTKKKVVQEEDNSMQSVFYSEKKK